MNYALYIARRLSLGAEGHKSSPAIRVSIAAVALSVAIMLASIAVVTGFKREIRDKVLGFNSHITLYSMPMAEDDDNVMTLTPTLASILEDEPYIRSFSLEASMPAILKTKDNFKGVYLRGLGSGNTRDFIRENLEEGEIPDFSAEDGDKQTLISRAAADQLGLKVGDRIDTYFITDQIRVRPLKIAGIFNTHFDSYDDVIIYGSLGLVQNLGKVSADQGTGISIETDDFNRVAEYSERLHNRLLEETAAGNLYRYYRVDNALNQGAGYFNWLALLDTNVVVVLALMTVVAVATLISGMLILILDKKRLIGLLRALGTPVSRVRDVFLFLAMKVAVYGLAIGNILMLAFLWLQARFHFIPLDPDAYYIDFVPVEIGWLPVLVLNVAVLAVIYVSLILPSRFVARISPAETMSEER